MLAHEDTPDDHIIARLFLATQRPAGRDNGQRERSGGYSRQPCKGKRASLPEVFDRLDPLIQMVGCPRERGALDLPTFPLDLPVPIEIDFR